MIKQNHERTCPGIRPVPVKPFRGHSKISTFRKAYRAYAVGGNVGVHHMWYAHLVYQLLSDIKT